MATNPSVPFISIPQLVADAPQRTSIPRLATEYLIEPFFGNVDYLLIGNWREEEPLDGATAFIAMDDQCRVLTDECGPVDVPVRSVVWAVFTSSSVDVGTMFVPRHQLPSATANDVLASTPTLPVSTGVGGVN